MLSARWRAQHQPLSPWVDLRLAALLCILLWALLAAITLRYADGQIVLPTDGAYLGLAFARAMASGEPFACTPGGDVCRGNTTLAYTALLAVVWLSGVRGDALVLLAQGLGTLWLWLVAAFAFLGVYQESDRTTARGAVALVLTNGALVAAAFGGTEHGLFCAALVGLWAGLCFARARWILFGATILALSRPEGALLIVVWAVLAWTDWALTRVGLCRQGGQWLARGLRSRWLLLPLVAGSIPFVCLWWITGDPRPNAWLVRTTWTWDPAAPLSAFEIATGLATGLREAVETALVAGALAPLGWPILVLALVGLCVLASQAGDGLEMWRLLPLTWVLLLLTLSAATADPENVTVLALPLLLPGTALGVRWMTAVLPPLRESVLFAVLVVLSALAGWAPLVEYGRASADLARHAHDAAAWLANRVPDAPIVALHPGVLSYARSGHCLDASGLCDDSVARNVVIVPQSVPHPDPATLFEFFQRYDRLPAYFVGYPAWYDTLVQLGVLRVRVSQTTEPAFRAGARTLAIFEINKAHLELGNECSLSQPDWVQVDALDICDLADERRHCYTVLRRAPHQPVERLLVGAAYEDGLSVIDGGRRILYAERFTLSAQPGKRLRLVARTTGNTPVRRSVLVGETMAGTWDVYPKSDIWSDLWYEIPAEFVQSASIEIRLNQLIHFGDAGVFQSFYYWAFQPKVNGAPPP